MSTSYGAEYVKCPFYKDHKKQSIRCEGYIEGRGLITTFDQIDDRIGQMRLFCCADFEKCEVYRMVCESRDY